MLYGHLAISANLDIGVVLYRQYNNMNIENEFKLLKEYLDIYIQILPNCIQCGGNRINKEELPTFEYFKKHYSDDRYSLVIPHYNEKKSIYDSRITTIHTHGINIGDGVFYRYYNYWMGCKYFIRGNIHGRYTVESPNLNNKI